MAVTLPSDLVADVMRNVDPARRSAAVARLDSLAGGARFAAAVGGLEADALSPAIPDPLPDFTLSASPGLTRQERNSESAYRGFERMVLRNLFESLLPDEGSGSFGTGPAASIWRSMAADQLAAIHAESGGIGIANLFASAGEEGASPAGGQWPYFGLKPFVSGTVKG